MRRAPERIMAAALRTMALWAAAAGWGAGCVEGAQEPPRGHLVAPAVHAGARGDAGGEDPAEPADGAGDGGAADAPVAADGPVAADEGAADAPVAADGEAPDGTPDGTPDGDGDGAGGDAAGPCVGPHCPRWVGGFPYHDRGDTRASADATWGAYSCAPATDEGGPEVVYVFTLDRPGTIVARVVDGAGVDVDLHLLGSPDPGDCLVRDDKGLSRHLEPGTWYLAADTWVGADGTVLAGAYDLYLHFLPDDGPCGLGAAPVARIGTAELLEMPATGMVVKEAHLVTAEEHAENVASGMTMFPSGWPASLTDGIEHHYELSQATSGFAAERGEPWAPCCEPSNEFGQGSAARPPAAAEAWYLNMRWKVRPAAGVRYLVFDAVTGRAVVAAGGYENGPGDLSRIGGVAEEVHLYLGTGHLATLTFGELRDQGAPYGPVVCAP